MWKLILLSIIDTVRNIGGVHSSAPQRPFLLFRRRHKIVRVVVLKEEGSTAGKFDVLQSWHHCLLPLMVPPRSIFFGEPHASCNAKIRPMHGLVVHCRTDLP